MTQQRVSNFPVYLIKRAAADISPSRLLLRWLTRHYNFSHFASTTTALDECPAGSISNLDPLHTGAPTAAPTASPFAEALATEAPSATWYTPQPSTSTLAPAATPASETPATLKPSAGAEHSTILLHTLHA
jgi:hypothetical protein